MQTAFDASHQLQRTRACQDFLLDFLSQVKPGQSALDVGCGVGLISQTLLGAGMNVTAVDARPENIAEAKRRCPDADFQVFDAEDVGLRCLGLFDIVVCFGLLYHLENPFMAVRTLCEIAKDVLVIESMVAPGSAPMAIMRPESSGQDTALRNISLLPTESCLVSICYQAGFSRVYRPARRPDNPYFRGSLFRKRQRVVLIATKDINLSRDGLTEVTERQSRGDLWARPTGRVKSALGKALRAIGARS